MATILVIEDEKPIQNVVRAYLENDGHEVVVAETGVEGLIRVEAVAPDLVVLDLNLPEMDGLEVARRLYETSGVLILMLTARAEENDRIRGLKIGADDYLTKPFSPRELVARVEALLRRPRRAPARQEIAVGGVTINRQSHEARAGETPVDLTPTEFKLLWVLMASAGTVLSRDALLEKVWGSGYYGTDRVVDVYVGQVRRKIEEAAGRSLIETVRGVGYKFVDEGESGAAG